MAATHCHLACFQETKLAAIDGAFASFLGGYKHNRFAFKPANSTRGGILLLWNDNYIDLQDIVVRRFSVTATVSIHECGTTFLLTVVYGPARDSLKQAFLRELKNSKPVDASAWLVLGDFNLIYCARDKNNRNLNLRRMRQFRAALSFCELREIHLQNRKFTWSNERRRPTLARLDRVFCNEHWDLTFEQHGLQELVTSLSDHCPLVLSSLASPRGRGLFGLRTSGSKSWVFTTRCVRYGKEARHTHNRSAFFTTNSLLRQAVCVGGVSPYSLMQKRSCSWHWR